MKFVISSNAMLTAIQAISKVIGGKSVLPILDNILLVATKDGLLATASDKETTLESKITLEKVEEEGKITIPAKNLLDLLKEFPEQPLTFDINETTYEVKIISDKGEFIIHGESAEDYPLPTPIEDAGTEITTKCGLLLDGITKTIFATASDDLRPVMNCILIEMHPDNFTFVASNAHKLVRYKRFDAKSETEQSLVLPKKPAFTLKNILPKDDSALTISFTTKAVSLVFGNYKMTSTLVEGKFPNYNSVIPQENPINVIVEKKELYNSLRRVSIVSNQASSLVKFELEAGKLTVSAQDVDYAMSGHEAIVCQYNGEALTIGFKSTFVQEILENIDSENVVLELSDRTRPGLFLPFEKEDEDEDLLMVLMPLGV
ncbi:DNA polymerase III subunit beta [Bacteroidia bacterium]|nr:DNA polymerase III subunit beta [Bacteroidia bacterium]